MSKKNKKYDFDDDNFDFTLAKGKYDYVDEADIKKMSKKDREKERRKMLKLKDKEIKKQCHCNHIARNSGRCYFKPDPNDANAQICKICGAKLLSPVGWSQLTPDLVELSCLVIRSITGLVRNRIKMNDETYEEFTKMLQIMSKIPDLYAALSLDDDGDDDPYDQKKKKKKNKDKKHGKHGKHGKKKDKDKKKKKHSDDEFNYRVLY